MMHTVRTSFQRKPESGFSEHRLDPGIRRNDEALNASSAGTSVHNG